MTIAMVLMDCALISFLAVLSISREIYLGSNRLSSGTAVLNAIGVPEDTGSKVTENRFSDKKRKEMFVMKTEIYNVKKLSEYRELFIGKRVLVIGAGAVGSYLMEFFTKMGLSPDVIDNDSYTLENAAKHSCLVRTPEDAGRNKAVCVSERVQPLLDEGCTSNGIDCDVCKLGPEALADYDYVILAVDNYAAKILANELIRQIPEERRPIAVMDGTYGESAQSIITDNTDFCLRCVISEEWLKDINVHYSCGGAQYRVRDGADVIVRTSNLASSMAAYLSAEQVEATIKGIVDGVMNRMVTYTAYPNLEITSSHPIRKENCPGCAIHPPAEIKWLHGSVLEVKLKDTINQLSEILGTTDFEITSHCLHYREVYHRGFVADDVCRSCGKPIHVMKHEGRTFIEDLTCDECSAAGKNADYNGNFDFSNGKIIYAFTPDTDNEIQEMTLYDLGYPLGAHIQVIKRNGAFNLADEKVEKMVFAFDEDHQRMHEIKKLS
ncbi:MAG: ThiF family adenylyltransferase [Oscillospiraceae bacterium]|nr:ThiF family adenylyltransferase [Oscillospiraceae bacterium]